MVKNYPFAVIQALSWHQICIWRQGRVAVLIERIRIRTRLLILKLPTSRSTQQIVGGAD